MKAGDAVLVRSVYRGQVRWCFPHRLVEEQDDRFVLYLQLGNNGKHMAHDNDYLVRWAAGEPMRDHVWQAHHVLWIVQLGEAHMLGLFWTAEWKFAGWYVSLQAPMQLNGRCFDSCDLALDIWIDPDGSWHWKDEDDLAEAQELGILDAVTAADVRAEGERVIASEPCPTGWEGWRPPAGSGSLCRCPRTGKLFDRGTRPQPTRPEPGSGRASSGQGS